MVVHRARADWPISLAAWLLLLSAATVVAADTLYADAVALTGLRRAVAGAPADERNVLVSTDLRADEAIEVDAAVMRHLDEALDSVDGVIVRVAGTSWLEPVGEQGDAGPLVSGLTSHEALAERASLVTGAWPQPGRRPLEASLPEETATALGISVGDTLSIGDRRDPSDPFDVEITAIWRPDADDPYWRWIAERDGEGASTTAPPLVVSRADLLTHAVSTVRMEWWAIPSVERLSLGSVDPVVADVRSLHDRLDGVDTSRPLAVRTNLPALLGDIGDSVLVTRAGILALGAQFAVLAVYAVVLVASILVERRRGEAALVRARGGSASHLAAMALGEALLLAVPVALAAPWLATLIVRVLAESGPAAGSDLVSAAAASDAPVLVAAAAAGAGVIGLTVASVIFDVRPMGARAAVGRPGSRTAAHALGIDVALVTLAAVSVWQLRVYGAPLTRNARGALGLDPLLIVAPAIGLLAGVVLATRLFPRLAQLLEWRLASVRSAVAPLGARQLARRPLRYTRSALLLMLAIGLGTFAAVYTVTWTGSQADQAAYRAAADVRVVTSQYADLPGWAVDPAYEAVAGVAAAVPVARQTISVGRAVRGGELVAFDLDAADGVRTPGMGDVPADAAAQLVAGRPAVARMPLPGNPRRLAVTLNADLDGKDLPAEVQRITVAFLVIDADGRPQRIEAPDGVMASFRGAGQRVEVALTVESEGRSVVLQGRLQLLAVEVAFPAPPAYEVRGSVEIVAVETNPDAAGGEWTRVASTPAADAWDWHRLDSTGVSEPYPDGEATRLIIDPATAPPFANGMFGEPVTYRWWSGADVPDAVPAIAGARFAEVTGARVGDTLSATSGGQRIALRIAGVVETFAPLDPARPFVIADGPTLDLRTLVSTGQTAPAQEWWLELDGDAAAALAQLREPHYGADHVIGRAELEATLSGDPVGIGIIGVLALGSLAAIAFAAIGFVVSATVSTSERVGELAILRALGLSTRELTTWLALENAVLLLFGLVSGCAVGLLLAWLVLPSAPLTATGEAPVPAVDVTVEWSAIVPFVGVAAALLVAAVIAVRMQLPKIRISDVLRGRGD